MNEYRIIRHVDAHNTETYAVYNVQFNEAGIPVSCDTDPITPVADSAQSLSHILIYMQSALTKPVLDYTLFMPESNPKQSTTDALDLLRSRK